MIFRILFGKFWAILLFSGILTASYQAQSARSTVSREETLLNGLKLVMLRDPAAGRVAVRLRVHAGSAFDPQGKEGVMKLLAASIFPNESAREFFAEDLGGELGVDSNYDYIQINASSQPDKFLTLLETLAAAVTNPTIDKETTEKLKGSQLKQLSELEKDPAYIADQTAANRLFGTFPYGRRALGTPASVQKIDFADVRFAKDRFFGADNATLVIAGKFDAELAYRAARRYFGAWLKSDKKVPATFRQPEEPDPSPHELKVSGRNGGSEVRFALRGLARNDRDFAAAAILSRILQSRLQNKIALAGVQSGENFVVRHDARLLPGILILGYRSHGKQVTSPVAVSHRPAGASPSSSITDLFRERITEAEFEKGRSEAVVEFARKPAEDYWLDADTYKIDPTSDRQALQKTTLSDVQRVAERFSKNPIATVTVIATGTSGESTN